MSRLRAKVRPLLLGTFPGKISLHKSQFSAGIHSTIALLKKELAMLHATEIVIELAVNEKDFRLDGLPKANASVNSPAVILNFVAREWGPMRIYFAKYNKWDHNLRAIALHLEHLRLASLHGVGKDGEQYAGWKAIAMTKVRFRSKIEAAQFITTSAGLTRNEFDFAALTRPDNLTGKTLLTNLYRTAAGRLHPDTAGGDHESFISLQEAKRIVLDEWGQ